MAKTTKKRVRDLYDIESYMNTIVAHGAVLGTKTETGVRFETRGAPVVIQEKNGNLLFPVAFTMNQKENAADDMDDSFPLYGLAEGIPYPAENGRTRICIMNMYDAFTISAELQGIEANRYACDEFFFPNYKGLLFPDGNVEVDASSFNIKKCMEEKSPYTLAVEYMDTVSDPEYGNDRILNEIAKSADRSRRSIKSGLMEWRYKNGMRKRIDALRRKNLSGGICLITKKTEVDTRDEITKFLTTRNLKLLEKSKTGSTYQLNIFDLTTGQKIQILYNDCSWGLTIHNIYKRVGFFFRGNDSLRYQKSLNLKKMGIRPNVIYSDPEMIASVVKRVTKINRKMIDKESGGKKCTVQPKSQEF